MSALTGNLISNTYQSLLKVGTNNTASANLNAITDGLGNETILSLSTTVASFSGSLWVTGSLNVSSNIIGTASVATSASYATTASFATSASNATTFSGLVSSSFALTGSANNFTANQTITGSLRVTGSIILSATSSFVLPLTASSSPVTGTAFFSGSHLYIYDGSAFRSASLA